MKPTLGAHERHLSAGEGFLCAYAILQIKDILSFNRNCKLKKEKREKKLLTICDVASLKQNLNSFQPNLPSTRSERLFIMVMHAALKCLTLNSMLWPAKAPNIKRGLFSLTSNVSQNM
ncbi:hypothetical protein GQX74_007689 [Glossina fuscipes]|nr:hypothetical protein GQX74_007689 [Glossina fuscipes]